MNPQQFDSSLRRKTRELERYVMNEFPAKAGRKILRFINGNFRAQGWQGDSFQRWQKNKRGGTILVKKGRLRRSFHQEITPGAVRTWNSAPYARVHNRGFNGTLRIKAFQRKKFTPTKVGTGRFTKSGKERTKTVHVQTGIIEVKAHTRKVNIVKRQYMPEAWNDSPVLVKAIRREVVNDIKKIFD